MPEPGDRLRIIVAFLRDDTQIMEHDWMLDTLLQSQIQEVLRSFQIARLKGLNTSSYGILSRR
ncbi:MAG TPA: hypothetical protein VKB49_09855 [Candidatus Sulfotelmatobacter sp.]|nr:hypothetical protein [Candidatus Sulfotelmatobacter sp.]